MPDCPPSGHPPFARTVETPKRPCAAGRRGAWGCGEVSPQVSPQLAGEAAGAISGLPACGSACRCLPWRRPCWWAASGSRPWLVGIPFSARHHTVAVGVHQPRVHAHVGLGSGLAASCAGVDLCHGGCTAIAGSGVSGSRCAAAGALVDLVLGRRGCHTARCRGVHLRGWAGGVVGRRLGPVRRCRRRQRVRRERFAYAWNGSLVEVEQQHSGGHMQSIVGRSAGRRCRTRAGLPVIPPSSRRVGRSAERGPGLRLLLATSAARPDTKHGRGVTQRRQM